MSDAGLFALLEQRGYRKWEIEKLDRWYILNVIFHPRDDKGQIAGEPQERKQPTPKDKFLLRCWRGGVQKWKAEAEWESRHGIDSTTRRPQGND